MTTRQERRVFGRRQTNILGWIKIDGRPKLRCSVRNVTPVGAFLELTPPSWLPFKFVLELESDGTVLGCEIRHTRSTGIGVQFVPSETVLEYAVTSRVHRNEEEEWLASPKSAPDAKPSTPDAKADKASLAGRIRGAISSKT